MAFVTRKQNDLNLIVEEETICRLGGIKDTGKLALKTY